MQERRRRRRLPPWLIGLVLALVIFAVSLLILGWLDFGDNPVIGSAARWSP